MPEEANIAADWLKQAANQRGIADKFSATFVRTDSNWLHFAVRLSDFGDASERATVLLELEDAWDAHEPHSNWHLMLIPASS